MLFVLFDTWDIREVRPARQELSAVFAGSYFVDFWLGVVCEIL